MSLRISEVTSGKSLDITNNARINVKATPGEKYYLIDEATGQTPKDLEVFREGDALYMRSAQYDVEVVIEEFWEACEAGNQCYAIFDTPAEVGGELIGQTIVTQEGEVLGALLAGEVGTLAENAAILGAWGGAIGSSAIIPSLVAVTGGLAVASMVEMFKSDDNTPAEDSTPPSLTVVAPDQKADKNPTISGKTTAPAGTEVTITITDKDGKEIKSETAKVQKDGSYSVAFNDIPEGTYTATAVIKNTQGQEIAKASDPGSVAVAPEVKIEVPANTADTTPTIKGTAPAGSEVTITVKDAQGKEQTIKATADKDGNFSADVLTALAEGEYTVTAIAKDAFGNTSEPVSKTGSVDSSLPEVTVEVPENTNDATPTIKGKAPAGSEVTITVEDGQGNKHTIKATADKNGNFSADVPTALADGAYKATAQVTAPNGKIVEASDNGNIDTVAPTLTLTIPENTADSTPTIKGHSDAPEGSKVAITVTDAQGNKQTIEATVKADGTFEADVPKELADGEYTVQASVQDEVGNIANAKQAIKVDSSLPEVSVEVPENTNDATPAIKGKAPAGSEVTITVKDAQGKEQTIKATADKDGNFSADVPKDLADGKYDVTAKAAAPNGKTAEAKDLGIIDTVAPEVYLNAPDNSRTATPTLSGKTDAPVGSEVTITVEDAQGKEQTIKATVKPDGTFEAKIPEGLADGAYTAKATVVDTAGNKGASSDGGSVNTKAPDAPQSYQDNVGDVQDPKSTAPTTDDTTPSLNIGKVPEGETPKLYDNGKEIPSDYDPATGTLTPKEPLSEGKHDLTYTLTDPAGNESPQSKPIAIEVITSAPAGAPNDGKAPVVEITTDTNNDSFINKGEAKPNVEVKVSFDKDKVNEGDIVVVTDNTDPNNLDVKEITIDATAKANGYVKHSFPMPKEGSNINISGSLKNPAGAESDKHSDTAKLDTSNLSNVPAGNGVGIKIVEDTNGDQKINKAELDNKQQISVEITLPKEAVAGDKLVVTGTGNPDQSIDLTPEQIAAGKVVIPFDAPANGTLFETTAKVSDAAGNESNLAKAEAKLDLNDIGAPQVAIEGQNGYINADQAKDGKANITITLPENAKAGETLTVADQNGNKQTITLSPEDIANKTVATDLPLPKEGEAIEVTATITDQSGNKSPAGKSSATLDTSDLSTGLAVTISEDTNNDGIINNTELKDKDIDVAVKLPQGAQVGDTLTITGSGNTAKTITLAQTDLDKGTVTVKFTPPANNSDFIATATIKDQAGNTSGAIRDEAKIQLETLGKPTVQITEDTNKDGFINKDELQGEIGVKITLPKNAKPNDTVHIDTNGDGTADSTPNKLTPEDIQRGYIAVDVPNPGEGKTLTVNAWLQDEAGNVGEKATPVQAQIDTTVPKAPTITIGSNENGESKDQITFDEVQTNGTVKTKVTLPNDAKEGDVLKIDTGSGAPIKTVITKEHLKDGYTFDLPIPKTGDKYDQGQKIQISAAITDKAGNTSEKGLANSTVNTNFDGEDTSYSENAKVGGIKTSHIFAGVVKASGSTESLFWNDGKPSTTSADGFYLLEKNSSGSYNMFLTPKGIADSEHSDFETGKNIFNYTILAKYADGVQKIGNWQVNLTNAADKAPSVTSQILNNPEENIVLTGGMENDKGLPENEILSVTFNGKTWTSADGGLVVQPDGTWTLKTGMKVNDLDNGSYNVDAKTTIKGEDPNSPMSSKMEDPSSGEITIAKPVDDKKLVLALNSDTAGAGTAGTNSDNITSDGVINVNNTNGNPWQYSLDGGQTWQAGTGTSFTLPESTELKGTTYSLAARLVGEDTTQATLDMTLDQTTEFKVNGASNGTIFGTGEAGGLVKIGYKDATGKEVTSEATVGEDGKWTMKEPAGWDSDVDPNGQEDKYAQITFVDKAGNTTKNGNNYLYVFDSLKNLNESYTVSDRPQGAAIYEGEFTGYGGKKITGLTFDYTPVQGNITIISTSTGPVTTSTFDGTNAPKGGLKIWRNLTGNGDDTVLIKGDVWTNVGFFLGEGNNKVDIGGGITAGSAKLSGSAGVAVVTGSGDDILNITNSSLDGAFDLGAGNNTINVGKANWNFDRNRITTKEGNDTVTIQDDVLSSIIKLGDGENILNIGGRLDFGRLPPNEDESVARTVSQIETGEDKDVVTIGDRIDGSSTINLGNGDNSLTITNRVDGYSKITTGDGNDTIKIGGKVDGNSTITTGGGNNTINIGDKVDGFSKITTGDGNDTIKIGADVDGFSSIKTGAGNDTVTITGRVDGHYIIPSSPKTLIDLGDGDDTLTLQGVYQKSEVLGGAGTDHLHITGNGIVSWSYNTVNMDHIGGFEHLHLDGKVNLDLNYSDLLSTASTGGATGAVYIHGDNNDRVDLGDNGSNLNDNGGTWSAKANTETVDNVEYQVYQHSTDATGEHLVYIQTGIEVI